MQEIYEFLSEAKQFYIAAREEDQPRVCPCGFVMQWEGKLYFSTTCEKQAYNQVLKNPRVELCAMAKGKWLRLAGTVVFDDSPEVGAEKKRLSSHLEKMYDGGAANPTFRLFYLKDCDARIYNFQGLVRQVTF